MSSFNPVEKHNRLVVVDALRGLALFGILIANLPFLKVDENIYQESSYTIGSLRVDSFLDMLFHLLIDKKFITIFSLLFGFGFYIQNKRAEERGAEFRWYYLRRMLLLLVIGCIHAYFIWFGDIIRDYAICGMVMLLVYKLPLKKILITGIVFAVFVTGLIFILNEVFGLPNYSYDTAIIYEHPQTSSYWRYLQINATIDPFVNFLNDSPITLAFAFGNMLIGYWLGKIGFFETPQLFRKMRKIIIPGGVTLGLGCSYLFWEVTKDNIELSPALIWLPFVIITGMILQSLMYVSLFIEVFKSAKLKKLLVPFSSIGKMALTNYILQSFFYMFVFFHFTNGLKLYGTVTLTETYLLALLFFIIQVLFSKWWMKNHDQGPVEYLWKRLSYKFFWK